MACGERWAPSPAAKVSLSSNPGHSRTSALSNRKLGTSFVASTTESARWAGLIGGHGRPNSVLPAAAGARRANEGASACGNQACGALRWHALTRLASLATLSRKRGRGDFPLAAVETVAPRSTESQFSAVTEHYAAHRTEATCPCRSDVCRVRLGRHGAQRAFSVEFFLVPSACFEVENARSQTR